DEARIPSPDDTQAESEPAPAGEPLTGEPLQRLGEYEVRGTLGQGGMGALYRGWQPLLERPVAIKVLPPSRAEDRFARERFLRQIRILGRVRHPHLVQVYGSGSADGSLYYAMEWIEGTTLAVILRALANPDPARLDLHAWQKALGATCGTLPPADPASLVGRP